MNPKRARPDAAHAFEAGTVLVTGGAGFIGSNFIRTILGSHRGIHVVNLDALTYAGNVESLVDVVQSYGDKGEGRYAFVHGDIRDFDLLRRVLAGGGARTAERASRPIDAVVHFAAESHVDRSLLGPEAFIDTNIKGTFTLLEACRAELGVQPRPFRFVHVSTDEVYGTLGPRDAAFTEDTPLQPNSPYSASKASSDLLVRSYVETFNFPAVITRCSNNYGPYQFPEKLIPLAITRAIQNKPLPIYGDGLQRRDWLHVLDHADAIWTVLEQAEPGSVYNIGGESETPNLEIVKRLLALLGKPETLMQFVQDRPGHDRRYAMDISRIRRDLGWSPRRTLLDGLSSTVRWYIDNPSWWQGVASEAYRAANALYLATPSPPSSGSASRQAREAR